MYEDGIRDTPPREEEINLNESYETTMGQKFKHDPPTKELREARTMLSKSCILIDNDLKGEYDITDIDLIKDAFRARGIISNEATLLCGAKQERQIVKIMREYSEHYLQSGMDGVLGGLKFQKAGITFTVFRTSQLPKWRMIVVPEPIV